MTSAIAARNPFSPLGRACWRLAMASWVALLAGCGADEPTLPQLVDRLQSADHLERYQAAKELGQRGDQASDAVYALVVAVEDKDPVVRIGAVYALAKIGPDAASAIPALTRALGDKDPQVRTGAAYAIPAMGPQAQSAVPKLRACLKDSSREVRQESHRALQRITLAVQYQNAAAPAVADSQP